LLCIQLHHLPHPIPETDRVFNLLFPVAYQVEDNSMLISFDAIGCQSLCCILWCIVCVAIDVVSYAAAMDVATIDVVAIDAATIDAATDVVTMTLTVIHVVMMEVPKTFDVVAVRVP
jgi:hypothetical protein